MDRLRNFWKAVESAGDGRFQPATTHGILGPVETVGQDGESATGPLDGEGSFTVQLKGKSAAQKDFLLVSYTGAEPVGAELTYVRHISSDYRGAGMVVVDANLPAPTFAAVPWVTTLIVLPGIIAATGTVYFNAVEARFQPTGYTISFRINGGQWADRHVPHIGGVQECVISGSIPPGASVDVHLRTKAGWAATESVPTADTTFTAAVDNSSPGGVTALAVSVATPGQLIMTPTATIDPNLFRGYQYEINDAATGSPDITSVPIPGPWDAVLPPGVYYVAARPVSKSGVLGGRHPATGFQGPYTVVDQTANLDTTPPAAMGAPTLAMRIVQFADNSFHGMMTVTRPAYTEPSDFAATEISFVVDDGRIFKYEMPAGVTVWDDEVGFGAFTVALRGRDKAGNAPVFGPTTAITIPTPTLSNAAPIVTTETVAAGIKVKWTRITNALEYEIERAATGTPPGSIGTYEAVVAADAPLIWLKHIEGTGTTAINEGSYAPDGLYNGGLVGKQQALHGLNSAQYDGVDDYVSFTDDPALDITGDLTLEALVYPTNYNDYRMIFTKGVADAGPYQLYLTINSGLPYFSDLNGQALFGTVAPPANQWSHIAVRRVGRTVTHYLNGVANGSGTLGGTPAANSEPLRIGRRSEAGPQYHFLGRISNPAIYNTAISAARVAAHSSAITNPPAKIIGTSYSTFYFDALTEDTIILPNYYYRVRARSVQDGTVITGTWSAWILGTVGAVDAQNLRVNSITAALIASNQILANHIAAGAITAGKLTADLILASMIRSANSGVRYEIEGATGLGGANQIRFYDATALRALFNGNGLYFYDTAGNADAEISRYGNYPFFSFGRNPSYAQRALDIYHNGTRYVSRFDIQAGELRFSNASNVVLLRDGGTGGGYNQIPQFYRENYNPGQPSLQIGANSESTMSLFPHGIEAVGGGAGRSWVVNGAWWTGSYVHVPTHLHVGPGLAGGGFAADDAFTVYAASDLGTGAGAGLSIMSTQYGAQGNLITHQHIGYRGQAGSGWIDARFLDVMDVDTGGAWGGGVTYGARSTAGVGYPFAGFTNGLTAQFFLDAVNNRFQNTINFRVDGTLSKAAGTFDIDHPDPKKTERYRLRHGLMEAATPGEDFYSYIVEFGPRAGSFRVEDSMGGRIEDKCSVKQIDDGGIARYVVEIPLPEYWRYLNQRPRWITENMGDGWGRCKSRIDDEMTTLTLWTEESGRYGIFPIGTRKDAIAWKGWEKYGVEYPQKYNLDRDGTIERRERGLAQRRMRDEKQAKAPATSPTVRRGSSPSSDDILGMMGDVASGKHREDIPEVTLWQ